MKIVFNTSSSCKLRSNTFGINLKHISDVGNLKKCDKLFVLAHPDDEVCFFGFLLKFLKKRNSKIQLLYTTWGQKGHDVRRKIQRYSINKMKAQRTSELMLALDRLQIKEEPVCLGLMDGETHLPDNRKILYPLIKRIIEKTQPRDVYTFDKSGITGHTDHVIAGQICRNVIKNEKHLNNIRLWGVGLTQKNADEFLRNTFQATQIFKFVRPSVKKPNVTIDVKNEVPQLIDAFREYKSQFTNAACDVLKEHFSANSKINLTAM